MVDVYLFFVGFWYGILVIDFDGNVFVVYWLNEWFVFVLNVKLFVIVVVFVVEIEVLMLDFGFRVIFELVKLGLFNFVLVGCGDLIVGFGMNCCLWCIESLVKVVVVMGIVEVNDIVGDDCWFVDECRFLGWSWDDLKFGYGILILVIVVNDNIFLLRVLFVGVLGGSVWVLWVGIGLSYFSFFNEVKISNVE